jgi:hypothetical protein
VTLERLRGWGSVDIREDDPRFTGPLVAHAQALDRALARASACGAGAQRQCCRAQCCRAQCSASERAGELDGPVRCAQDHVLSRAPGRDPCPREP